MSSGMWHDASVIVAFTSAAKLINIRIASTWPSCANTKAGVAPSILALFRSALQSTSSCRHSVCPFCADLKAVHHTKVLSGTKKERNQWVFFVVKGIIGQRYYESDFWPDLAR